MNKKLLVCIFLILSVISVSAVSAQDNATDIAEIGEVEEIELTADNQSAVEELPSTVEVSSAACENDRLELDTEEDVYFNASSYSDGDGSKNNPFKYVTPNRLPYGCTAYFANGVYEIGGNCRLLSNDGSALFDVPTKVTFIGESTDGVIFKNVNLTNIPFTVADNSRLYIYNATFDNSVIENRGRLEAYGVVFKNGRAIDHYYATTTKTYNNKFGGAIFSPGSHYALVGTGMKSYLVLEDCVFMNNSAVYGGAIYHDYGTTKIRNTKFIDNYAELYGGVLATDGGSIDIENCEFINYGAANDAGGAIYAKTTNLTVKNAKFHNGYGDFGGAICELNSNLIIENVDFYNNTARYEGGAVYIMYGDITVKNANFTVNNALDGGALFVDNCTNVNLNKVKFDKSTAKRYGGTIFSNGHPVDTANDITFGESQAPVAQVVYHQDKYDYDIGYNAEYELMKYNSSYQGVLPSRFDLRELGYVTPVRDQQEGGNCWAFAGIAALESCILKATGKSIDLSEENVKNLIELYSAYGWKEDTNEGGHSEMTWGNLISWIGPVLESDDPYDDFSTLSTLFDAIMHVQNVYYLPARTSFTDNDEIKRAIMDYGAVSVTMYADFTSPMNYDEKTASYFLATSTTAYANHAVTVVGWDDDYDKNKFPLGDMAETNGAWIVKNSWNTDWGDEGYFYVSYYDPVVFKKGEKNVAYTFILNDTVKYNRNYQYDIGGMTDFLYPTGNNQTLYYKNTFAAIGNDILSAASTIFEDEMDYELSIYINDALKHTQKGHAFAGYNTIPLTTEYQLSSGDKFTVQFKISREGGASFPICEVVTATRLTYGEGISFFSTNGQSWNDLYTFTLDRPDIEHRYASQVACIKAFTRSSGQILSTSTEIQTKSASVAEPVIISAIVKDENGIIVKKGVVTFELNGVKESVQINNGIAEFKTTFSDEGTFDVKASFESEVYRNSQTTGKITVSKSSVKSTTLNIADVTLNAGENSDVEATLLDVGGNPVAGADVKLTVNGVTQSQKTDSNGVATFTVNLESGTYTATAAFEGNTNYASSTKFATLTVTECASDVVDVKVTGNGDGSLSVTVKDDNGNAVVNKEVSVTVDGVKYTAVTDSMGIATVKGLSEGRHDIDVEVPGKTISSSSQSKFSVDVSVKTSTIEAEDLTRAQGSSYDFQAKFYDKNGNPLEDKEVNFIINGNDYFIRTDEYGVAKLSNKLPAGNYTITVINPATGDSLIRNATIVKRITGNKNIKIDYSYTSAYKIRVFSDNGQAAGAGEQVVIKIDGKKVKTAITDKDGYVTYKLSKSLSVKTHKITATYKGVTVSNKVTVKQIIKAKNKSFKKSAKSKKFTVTLKTSKGKAIKGKKITFKVKGKIYTAKTNKKGVATVKISNLNKVGKYKISVKYLKNTVKKTITIKK